MTLDEEMRKTLRMGRYIYTSFLVASLIYIIMLVWLRWTGISAFLPNDPIIIMISAGLGFLGAISLAGGVYCPRWFKKSQADVIRRAFTASYLRWIFFNTIAIYGFVLGILGARWEIFLPFFVISIGAQLLSFPTEERWKRMME